MAAVLMLAGAYGAKKALDDRADDTRKYNLLLSRTDEYEAVSARLAEGDGLEKVTADADKLREKHDKNRAKHQMALATYSATRGGLKQGQEAMAQANDQLSATALVNQAINSVSSLLSDPRIAQAEDEANLAAANYQIALRQYNDAQAAYFDALVSGADQETLDIYSAQMAGAQAEMEMYNSQMEAWLNSSGEAASSFDMSKLTSSLNTIASYIDMYLEGKATMEAMKLQVLRDSITLAVEKEDLEREARELEALEAQESAIKADQRRQTSLKVMLTANSNIGEAMKRSSDVLACARRELTRFEGEYKGAFLKRACIYALMLIAAAAGILSIPGAFERVKKRAYLVLPPVVFTVLAGAAEALSMLFGYGQQYAALFAFILGIADLIIVLPREKLPESDDDI